MKTLIISAAICTVVGTLGVGLYVSNSLNAERCEVAGRTVGHGRHSEDYVPCKQNERFAEITLKAFAKGEAERVAAVEAEIASRITASDIVDGDVVGKVAVNAANHSRSYGCTRDDFRKWSGWTRKAYQTDLYWVRCGYRSQKRVYWVPSTGDIYARNGS